MGVEGFSQEEDDAQVDVDLDVQVPDGEVLEGEGGEGEKYDGGPIPGTSTEE